VKMEKIGLMDQGQSKRRRNKTQGNHSRRDSSESEKKEEKEDESIDRGSDYGKNRRSE